MTNQDAKLVLSTYRPGNTDAGDPFFGKALEQARRDPKLGKWLAQQRMIDDTIVAKLLGIEPPAILKQQILARLRGCSSSEPLTGSHPLFSEKQENCPS